MRRRVFNHDQRLYAAKPLKSLGQEFAAGEEIPWKALGWPVERMQTWFNARLISHFPGGDMSPEATAFYNGFDLPGRVAQPQQPSKKSERRSRV